MSISLLVACTPGSPGRPPPEPPRAPASCEHVESFDEEGDPVEVVRYVLDAEGRIASFEVMNDAAAFASVTQRRYDAEGDLVEERVEILEGPDEEALGPAPPTAVHAERRRGPVTVRFAGARPELSRVETWMLDERGYPTRIVIEEDEDAEAREASEVSATTCAFDLEGRLVYWARFRGESVRAERWLDWSGDTLSGSRATWYGEDGAETGAESSTFRARGGELERVAADGAVIERWRGTCDAFLHGACSPVFAPLARPGAARPRVPPSRGAPVGPPQTGPGVAFPEAALAAPLRLRALRAAYPTREVWTSATFYENSPDTPYAFVCVGTARRCLTRIEHDEAARARLVETIDPELAGPAGVEVGATYERVAPAFVRCERRLGLEQGVACLLRGAPHVEAWFQPAEERMSELVAHGEDVPPEPALIAGRPVERLVWHAPAR
ncbi:MAG: hypothetical protein KF729_17410 [Sandaracinaceae bacterium]|nr:hypothetical protein [Sandaracinaceae bacterium]